MYEISNSRLCGELNGRALLTDAEVQYLKDHRDIPMYVLYDEFSEKISYAEFKEIYLDHKWKHITTTTSIYPFNLEFSCQFTNSKLDYDDIVQLREQYNNGVYWKIAYEPYKELYPDEYTFWNIYYGNKYKLIKPEVFTEENRKLHSTLGRSGEKNGRAKLTENDVRKMRYEFENKIKTRKQIQDEYKDKICAGSVNQILKYTTWKNIK